MRNLLSFVLGFTFVLAIGGTLSSCSNGQSIPNTIGNLFKSGNTYGYPVPNIGQWVDYGGSEPTINGNSFAFPCCNGNTVAGYFYTQLSAVPQPGQTLTLNYTITGTNPAWQAFGDTIPPTLHLFLWRKNDDLTCGGDAPGDYRAQYRMFAARTPVVLGANQTINIVLDPNIWAGCFAAHSTTAQWSDLLNNLLGVGFTFGGQNFAGHGIYLTSGSAQFTINSLTVH